MKEKLKKLRISSALHHIEVKLRDFNFLLIQQDFRIKNNYLKTYEVGKITEQNIFKEIRENLKLIEDYENK